MQITRAHSTDAERLSRIAFRAKAHWGYPAEWLEAWRDSLTVHADEIGVDEYLVALSDDGKAVGFCAVNGVPGGEWWLEHLWVLPEWQGRGVGRRLFDAAVAYVREWGGEWIDLRSDPHAEGFYLRMGAVRTGEVDATVNGVPRTLPELRYAIV